MAQRSFKLPVLGLGLILVFAELAAIVWVANAIGWWTLALLLATTALGIFLLQREWRKAWRGIANATRSGKLPSGRLTDATLILLGGVLLVLPGLLSDVTGLLLLLPFTRPLIRSGITWWASRTLQSKGMTATVIKGDVISEQASLIPAIEARPGAAPSPRESTEAVDDFGAGKVQ